MDAPLKIMLLAGGPDLERDVSLKSGRQVAIALQRAGHDVTVCDIGPDDPACLDRFTAQGYDVLFPVLHGPWGEGGGLQRLLDERGIAYVGSQAEAAQLAMDKFQAKALMRKIGVPTADAQVVAADESNPADLAAMNLPVVVKPVDEGSSLGLTICHDLDTLTHAVQQLLKQRPRVLVERYVKGRELTVGVLGTGTQAQALPVIEIVPDTGSTTFYDYDAKYTSQSTGYRFDSDLGADVLEQASAFALALHHAIGARHLSRTDFMVDAQRGLFCLEINTLPGFTDHSLVPMAANKAGIAFVDLCDRLARMGVDTSTGQHASSRKPGGLSGTAASPVV